MAHEGKRKMAECVVMECQRRECFWKDEGVVFVGYGQE
jgi:hypothetical protein